MNEGRRRGTRELLSFLWCFFRPPPPSHQQLEFDRIPAVATSFRRQLKERRLPSSYPWRQRRVTPWTVSPPAGKKWSWERGRLELIFSLRFWKRERGRKEARMVRLYSPRDVGRRVVALCFSSCSVEAEKRRRTHLRGRRSLRHKSRTFWFCAVNGWVVEGLVSCFLGASWNLPYFVVGI